MAPERPHRTVSRLRWILPALLALAWLALGAFAGPFAGKLSEVAVNDGSAFLPSSAESTEVNELRAAFDENDVAPAVVVVERPGGLEPADLDYLEAASAALADLPFNAGPPIPPQLAEEAAPEAAQLLVLIDAEAEQSDAVAEIRSVLESERPEGLTVLVTGQAALGADLGEAFAGVDGLLLLVAAAVVAVILVLVYRSPLLPILVLLSCGFALAAASAAVYVLADAGAIDLNGQSQGILFILVFGAATDYALLLVARFREELMAGADRFGAIRRALRATIEPIAASAGTVILGVLCLLFSQLESNRGLGPVAAIGIAASFLAATTFLPAVLALFGRAAFWPRRTGADRAGSRSRLWSGVAGLVARRPRAVWLTTAAGLVVAAAFMTQLKADGTTQTDVFLTEVDSVAGQEIQAEHFAAGSGAPAVIVADADSLDAVLAAAEVEGVAAAAPKTDASGQVVEAEGLIEIEAVLEDAPDSDAAMATVERLRESVHAVDGADAKVGGPTAVQLDTLRVSERDRAVIIPIVLAVILGVLMLLLRSILAPLLLTATVVLSFGATMGVSALVFNHLFGFPGADPAVVLFGFVFLVALGIDYNIFLMTRVREESIRLGTKAGALRGLVATGGVITSAGVVLAATFSALAVLPILFLAQIAFVVAFGVLLDTIIVRSLLVPALTVDIGRSVWWPSRLSRVRPLSRN
ncbi:MMPL family transporter [Glycomyces sp. TRM65418]|uniref:MMPL family transporter n=1 Tax=Glycomyces sp. TRM65418 TaxID=2867006 RepID=UPI001CE50B2C|nr:efflux RND transporter permease subunit [Glycomyces sp. TRM65418]MCC3764248.1 MMPL family transporter [Glycomyces sp. TRM65418]QZD53931.1 MMPL family transporter [Glycomyces sp. TRM65418]